MPKKKVNPAEEPEQAAGRMEQAGEDTPAPMGEPPQDMGTRDDALHPELGEAGDVPPNPGDAPDPPEDGEGDAPEVLAVDASAPPLEEPMPGQDTPPAPPMTDRQSFFALDFHELDRGLSQEERQAWNSIYASFRGHSALSGTVIGADPHSMNVRNKETGQVERRTMYCVVVLVYRVPVYIPATEMWTGEARPDYVLQNMMGASIDFIEWGSAPMTVPDRALRPRKEA